MWRLRLIRGDARPTEIEVAGELLFGRGRRSDVRIASTLASRQHARISLDDDGPVVEDLRSANGIEVNGRSVDRARLAVDDVLRVGDAEFVVEADGDDGDSAERTSSVGADSAVRVESTLRAGARDSTPDVDTWLADAGLGSGPLVRLAAGAARELDADEVVVLVRLEMGGPYRVVIAQPPRGDGRVLPVSRALLARAEVAREALLLTADMPDLIGRESVALRSAGSALCAPLVDAGEVIGALYVERGAGKPRYRLRDLDLAAGVAHAAGPSVATALQVERDRESERALRGEPDAEPLLVGASEGYLSVLDVIERVAGLTTNVVLEGEPGTGKRTLARAVHDGSPRRDGPFVVVPCPALPASRARALLFGSAENGHILPGLIDDAAAGTLCLAEIGGLTPDCQAALAAALQSHSYRPVGADEDHAWRCRLLATSERPLQQLVDDDRFDERLHALLSLVVVRVPPLRSRREDVPLLARFFASRHGVRIRHRRARLQDDVLAALSTYRFPGNVGELSNLIEHMVLIAEGDELDATLLPGDLRGAPNGERPTGYTLEESERAAVKRALRKAAGRKGKAAELLGVSWPTLTKKIRKYGLDTD